MKNYMKTILNALLLKLETSINEIKMLLSKKADKSDIVQSDWNQNNEDATDYVKNRTHWDSRKVIVHEATYDGNLDNALEHIEPFVKISDKLPNSIEDFFGNPVKAIFEGTIQEELMEEGLFMPMEANIAYAIGEVFLIVFQDYNFDGISFSKGIWTIHDTEAHSYGMSISWKENLGELKQIDEKYLPKIASTPDWNQNDENAADYIKNRTHYEIPEIWTEVALLDDTWGDRATCKLASTPIEWAENNSYKIRIDNTIYTFEGMEYFAGSNATANEDVYYIGADYRPRNTSMEFSEYPFCLLTTDFTNIYAVFEDGTTNHTVEIFASTGVVYQLDEKYIPDSIARAEDVANVANDIAEVSSQKMDAVNPVGTGSFSMNRKTGGTVGGQSCAIGNNCTASGAASHAEGWMTIASGDCSHAEGITSIASGQGAHAEGGNPLTSGGETTASGEASHAEGLGTTASGAASHAEGLKTIASRQASHTEGSETNASGIASHAEGLGTIASSDYSHVQGKFNIENTTNKYAHIVGNGDSERTRSNAHTLDWNGVGWFQGGLKVGGTGQDDAAAKEVVLVGAPQHHFTLIDDTTSYEYIIRMQNGNLTSICKASSLAVSTLPTKTTYTVGETLDLTDMVVTLTRQDGATEEINNYSYTEPDMSVAGTVDVTVSYVEAGETYSATFAVTITEATTTEETETTT